jgi:hypothetical protein
MKKNEINVIYVKEDDVPLTKTRKQLIRYFLRGKSIPTYSDPECKKLQCDGKGQDTKINAFRSITDLHMIVKSRFPETQLKTIVKIIYEFIKEDKNVILIYCNMIKKVVVKYSPNSKNEFVSIYSKKNYYDLKGIDGYSLNDYEKMQEL